jgi:hypothetical protein
MADKTVTQKTEKVLDDLSKINPGSKDFGDQITRGLARAGGGLIRGGRYAKGQVKRFAEDTGPMSDERLDDPAARTTAAMGDEGRAEMLRENVAAENKSRLTKPSRSKVRR